MYKVTFKLDRLGEFTDNFKAKNERLALIKFFKKAQGRVLSYSITKQEGGDK